MSTRHGYTLLQLVVKLCYPIHKIRLDNGYELLHIQREDWKWAFMYLCKNELKANECEPHFIKNNEISAGETIWGISTAL